MEDLSCISPRVPNLWQFLNQNTGYNQIFSLLDRKAHEQSLKINRYYLSHVDRKNEKLELNWLNQSLDIPLFSLHLSMPHLQQCFLWEKGALFHFAFFLTDNSVLDLLRELARPLLCWKIIYISLIWILWPMSQQFSNQQKLSFLFLPKPYIVCSPYLNISQ